MLYSIVYSCVQGMLRSNGEGMTLMQAIKNKLTSRRGASITFALLLFLVCAVIGSVVLVAGTASSGRLSQMAIMEQRYYAVNSAAELLAGEICGEKNEVIVVKEEDGSRYFLSRNAAGSLEKTTEADSIPKKIALLVMGLERLDGTEPATVPTVTKTITITVDDHTELSVDVTLVIENGTLVFVLENKLPQGSSSTDRYYLQMKMQGYSRTENTDSTICRFHWTVVPPIKLEARKTS